MLPEQKNIEQGLSNDEGLCRKMATKIRTIARKTAKPDVGQGSVRQEMQATVSRGFWWLFATLRGNRLRIPPSEFDIPCSIFCGSIPATQSGLLV